MQSETELRNTSRAHKRLMNKALHYLGRYQASQQKLRQTLRQFARRKLLKDEVSDADEAAIARAIEDVIALCCDYGYVDDSRLATAKAHSAVLSGVSRRRLSQKLQQMGIDEGTRNAALHTQNSDWTDPELAAGLTFARKKKCGPFGPEVTFEEKQKQMAKLARAGFSLDLIRQILELSSAQEAEDLLAAAQTPPDEPF